MGGVKSGVVLLLRDGPRGPQLNFSPLQIAFGEDVTVQHNSSVRAKKRLARSSHVGVSCRVQIFLLHRSGNCIVFGNRSRREDGIQGELKYECHSPTPIAYIPKKAMCSALEINVSQTIESACPLLSRGPSH